MKLRRAFAMALVILGLGTIAPAGDAPRFEVLVLATIHAPWQFRSARFTPAHVRAALAAAHPDVLGVESPPEWFSKGRYHPVTYEAQGIAVPFAKERGIPVVGIDWQDLPAREQREADMEAQQLAMIRRQLASGNPLPLPLYGKLAPEQLRETSALFRSPESDFDLVNGVEALAGADVASPRFGGRRNQEIAARCVAAMDAHPGKRLVVVIGAGHKQVLDALFARMKGVRVLRWGEDVEAPSAEAVERDWTTDDLLAALGHNLDGERSYFHPGLVDLPRMRDLLRLLEERPGTREAAAYFRARIDTAEASLETDAAGRDKRLREAERLSDKLAAADLAGTIYPFPMDHWRMRYTFAQAVRLERARLRSSRPELDALARELASGDATTAAGLLAREFPRTLTVPSR
jgi:hypothetical protein